MNRRAASSPVPVRARRRLVLAIVGLALLAGPASAQVVDEDGPFPVGACVRSTLVDPKPVCVLIDNPIK